MAKAKSTVGFKAAHVPIKKGTSQGQGGRGRKISINMSTMNKNRKRSFKKYRGQGK